MIGRLKKDDAIVTLNDDFTWSCPDSPALAALFNACYDRSRYGGPSDGFPGPFLFELAVEESGATVLDTPKPIDAPLGRIY